MKKNTQGISWGALIAIICINMMCQSVWGTTKEVLLAPGYCPKSGHTPSSITRSRTEIHKDYEELFKGAYEFHSYGKFKVNLHTMDFVKLPWPLKGSGKADKSFEDKLSKYGGGETLQEKKDGKIQNQQYTDQECLYDGYFTPGERFKDLDGNGRYTKLTPWFDSEPPENKSNWDGVVSKHDAYGEEFVDWNGDGQFTSGNIEVIVYDERKDSGKGLDSYFFGGASGDGVMGANNPPAYATRSIDVSELDLNIGDYFSDTHDLDTTGSANFAGGVDVEFIYPGDWSGYCSIHMTTSSANVAVATIESSTDFGVYYYAKTDSGGTILDTLDEVVTNLNASPLIASGDNVFKTVTLYSGATGTDVATFGRYYFSSGNRVYEHGYEGDRVWDYYGVDSNPGSPTISDNIGLNKKFDSHVVDDKDVVTLVGAKSYRTVDIGSGSTSPISVNHNHYRSQEIVEGGKDFKDREPFEDYMIRWDFSLGNVGKWVIVEDYYMKYNYPESTEDLTATLDNPPAKTPLGALAGNLFYLGASSTFYHKATDFVFLNIGTSTEYSSTSGNFIRLTTPNGVPESTLDEYIATGNMYTMAKSFWIDVDNDAVFTIGTDEAYMNGNKYIGFDYWADIPLSPTDGNTLINSSWEDLVPFDTGIMSFEDTDGDGVCTNNDYIFNDVNLNGVYDSGDQLLNNNTYGGGAIYPVSQAYYYYTTANTPTYDDTLTDDILIWMASSGKIPSSLPQYNHWADTTIVNNANIPDGPNGIGDNLDILLARTGNGVYDGPDPFEDSISEKIHVYKKDQEIKYSVLATTPAGATEPEVYWQDINDVSQAAGDNGMQEWWEDTFGSGAPGDAVYGSVQNYKYQTYDPTTIRPFPIKDGALVGGFGGASSGDGRDIFPDASGKCYDSEREFRDLPSSLYHKSGDLRFGETNDPGSESIAGAQYVSSTTAPKEYYRLSGPMAVKLHGHTGYDTGNQAGIELMTWRTMGRNLTDEINPDSFYMQKQLSSNGVLYEVADSGNRLCRDTNLDGLVDQGKCPPADFYNYYYGANPAEPDNGTGDDDYPFNRVRLIEDLMEANDAFLDFDQMSPNSTGGMDYIIGILPESPFQPLSSSVETRNTMDSSDNVSFNYNLASYARGDISTMVHESNHDWGGLADLYDTSVFSEGVELSRSPMGELDVMSDSVLEMTPISKFYYGNWIDPSNLRDFLIPEEATTLDLYPVERDSRSYFVFDRRGDFNITPSDNNQYFWFYYASGENENFSHDRGIHIIEVDHGYNPEGLYGEEPQNNAARPGWRYIQADGLGELEAGLNSGDEYDHFGDKTPSMKTTFNDTSYPKNNWSDDVYSGIEILNMVMPNSGDMNSPAKVTFIRKNTDVPSLTFKNPPDGEAIQGRFMVKMDAFDRFGGSAIYLYRTEVQDYSDSSVTSLTSTLSKTPGLTEILYEDDMGSTATGGYYYFAKMVPGTGNDAAAEIFSKVYALNNKGDGALSVTTEPTVTSSTTISTNDSTQQTWTVECTTKGGDGVAIFSVTGSVTGVQSSTLTSGTSFTVNGDYTGGMTILVSAGSTDFSIGDSFYVRTPGVTAFSEPIYLKDGQTDLSELGAKSLTVTEISGDTSEGSKTATFSVKLNTQPEYDVYISLASSDENEGVVDKSSLVFSTFNWNTNQVVTVTGVDDLDIDGDVNYYISLSASSNDSEYNDLDAVNVVVLNKDDDTHGLVVSATGDIVVDERESTEVILLSLLTQPTGSVRVNLSTSDNTEMDVNPTYLDFNSDNYRAAQAITVKGIDDDEVDGIQVSQVEMRTTSTDQRYSELLKSVNVYTIDDDLATVVIIGAESNVSESGKKSYFKMSLSKAPVEDVKVRFTSNDESEGVLINNEVVFNSQNYTSPQKIWVQGVDDSTADGDVSFTISSNIITDDEDYGVFYAPDVAFVNLDNDVVGVSISEPSGMTSESGGEAYFTVRLNTKPTAPVIIPVQSSSVSEATTQYNALYFTEDNYAGEQKVIVTGANDDIIDGISPYSIYLKPIISSDSSYSGFDPSDVDMYNADDDSPEILVSVIDGDTSELNDSAVFSVVLSSEPTANVVVDFELSDSTEGAFTGSSSSDNLVFTPLNYNQPQQLHIYGVDDDDYDGHITYFMTGNAQDNSLDTSYQALQPFAYNLVNYDSESAYIFVENLSNNVNETGGQSLISIKLSSQPSADVVVPVSVSDSTEAKCDVSSLIFNKGNYNREQIVTITGVDDEELDGDVSFNVSIGPATSADDEYDGFNPTDIWLVNQDDDQPGVLVSVEDTKVSEDADQVSFGVKLYTQPSNLVKIYLYSSNTGEGVINKSVLNFTSSNYNTTQTVTVTGVNDNDIDGDTQFYVVFSSVESTDAYYNGLKIPNALFVNEDNDTPGYIVSEHNIEATEGGDSGSFTLALKTAPTADVTVSLVSGDSDEASVSPASLTFTSSNYDTPQEVTVAAVQDAQFEGINTLFVSLSTSSVDLNYHNSSLRDILVVVYDDDIPGIYAEWTSSDNITDEGGSAISANLRLTAEPSDNIIVSATLTDSSEAVITSSENTFVFNADTYSTDQLVEIVGIDDAIDDGTIASSLVFNVRVVGNDSFYSTSLTYKLDLITEDDTDTAGITSSTMDTEITEGQASTFSLSLASEPVEDVTVNVVLAGSDYDEVTVSPQTLTFTSTNYNQAQTVTLDLADDGKVIAGRSFTVDLNTTSDDATYNGMAFAETTIDIIEDDSIGVYLLPEGVSMTSEDGISKRIAVRLRSELETGYIKITMSSSDTTEGTVVPSVLTFSGNNWRQEQYVYVTGEDDSSVDGAQNYEISASLLSSTDLSYDSLWEDPDPVEYTNIDDESANIILSSSKGQVNSFGDYAYFDVLLPKPLVGTLTFSDDSSDALEYFPSSISYTGATVDLLTKVAVRLKTNKTLLASGPIVVTPTFSGTTISYANKTSIDSNASVAGMIVRQEDNYIVEYDRKGKKVYVKLAYEPSASVKVTPTVSLLNKINISPSDLTFTSSNYSTEQSFTLVPVNDTETMGSYDLEVELAMSSDDASYADMIKSFDVSLIDDDRPGYEVSALETYASDAGRIGKFAVRLHSAPESNVTVPLSLLNSGSSLASLGTSSLVFSPTNYSTFQTVTVLGIDNEEALDADESILVRLHSAESDDEDYNDLQFLPVRMPVIDHGSLEAESSTTATIMLHETDSSYGESQTFSLSLKEQITGKVVLNMDSDPSYKVSYSPSILEFDPHNYSVPQTVTIRGDMNYFVESQNFNVIAEVSDSESDMRFIGAGSVFALAATIEQASIIVTARDDSGTVLEPRNGAMDFVWDPIIHEGSIQFSATGGDGNEYSYILNSTPASYADGLMLGTATSGLFDPGTTNGSYTIRVNSQNQNVDVSVYTLGSPEIKNVLRSNFETVKISFSDLSPEDQYYKVYYSIDDGVTWVDLTESGPVRATEESDSEQAKFYKFSSSDAYLQVNYYGADAAIFKILSSDATGSKVSPDPPQAALENTALVVKEDVPVDLYGRPSLSEAGGGGGCLLK
ncbi:MAG: hypothetical protein HQL32_03265 [Planctomycetes bacterium]|nr:hypothetical protein [Planctomycetota bacterium]